MMSRGVARLSDSVVGICLIHGPQSGTIITGSDTFTVDGLKVARLNDVAQAGCGHTGNIVSGSTSCTCDGRSIARLNDSVTGIFNGIIVSSSTTFFVDD
jgi:uncharacterized Zn-binding protein involved in type VI secretion